MSHPQGKFNKEEMTAFLWKKGVLVWKLDENQKILYEMFHGSQHKTQTWLLSRRSGKSFCLAVIAIEQCLRKKNSIVKILAPTKLQINNILRPIFRRILEDCPKELMPELREKDYTYYFKNGSEIQLAGTDNGHSEKLRGGDSDVCFVDEAGSCDDLRYIVRSILLPTTLMTKGKIVLASTPPKEPDHDFLDFIEEADKRGSLVKKTVYDNPRLTKEQIEELIEEQGGLNSPDCRRELFCDIIRHEETVVFPEFNEALEKEIVKEWPQAPFYDAYVGMDIGGRDLTALVFGYYDFRSDKIIIQDELVVDFQNKDNTIRKLADETLKIERSLWKDPFTADVVKPYLRVSDINHIVVQELFNVSDRTLAFVPAKKDDFEAAIRNLRLMIASKKIIISPKCKTLIRHLRNCRWAKSQKSQLARSIKDSHYDAVMALLYLSRAVNTYRNPYPANYQMKTEDMLIINKPADSYDVFKKIFRKK